jgi:acetyltransferase-like isoleucine patch superfamily enzyme
MSEYHVTLYEPHTIHHTALLGDGTVVYAYTTIGEGVEIGKDCLIGACVFLPRHCRIGNGTRIHHGAALAEGSIVGNQVYIGIHVVFTDVKYVNLRHKGQEDHRPPVVEDDAVIGCNAVLLPGVVVHRGAVVGAGSVVTRDIGPGVVVAGNPARPLRTSTRKLVLMPEPIDADGTSVVR